MASVGTPSTTTASIRTVPTRVERERGEHDARDDRERGQQAPTEAPGDLLAKSATAAVGTAASVV